MLANFSNLITFSRGSNATLTDASGRLTYAPHNLLTNSETFEAAAWTKLVGASVTPNTAVAPDGSITADTVTLTASAISRVEQTVTVTSGATYIFSVWMRVASGTLPVRLIGIDTGAGSGFTVTTEWQRFSITQVASSGTRFPAIATDGTAGSVFVWGAQLEAVTYQTTPSAYNRTSVANLLSFSEAFDSGNWVKAASSIVTNAQANPVNGLFNAQKLMEDTTNTQHFIYNSSSVASGPVTLSVYAKFAGRRWLRLSASNGPSVWFDLVNGVLGTVTAGATASITSVGNGWYRCSSTVTYNNPVNYIFLADANNSFTHLGDGNSGIYIYGAQLSSSASVDPYVPTPGAAPSSTAYYGPRFDYDPVTLAPKGILIEEARTNLLTYSEQLDNAAWVKVVATVTANATQAPNGVDAADKIVSAASTGQMWLDSSNFSATTGSSYAWTVYAKAAEYNLVQLRFTNAVFANAEYATFNLSTGTITQSSGTGHSITNVGNGWYRCTIIGVATATTLGTASISLATNATGGRNPSITGDGASGVFVYGAQLEAGAFATSYIPTVASTATRNADVALIGGSLFNGWYNQSEGAWSVQWVAANGNFVVSQISGSSSDNRFLLLSSSSDQVSVTTASVSQGVIDAGTINSGAVNKLSYSYRTNDTAASLNGGVAAADTTVTLPTVDRLCIGATVTPSAFLCGHIQSIQYIPNAISNTQLQSLTAS